MRTTTNDNMSTRARTRTLGDLSPEELLRTARRDLHALSEHVDSDAVDPAILRAYLGSIGARLALLDV